MVTKKPRIVIIGAGMAGLTAANQIYTSTISDQLFDLSVVEGGSRIGGRINSSEFCGDRIELGATWIHGIEGSPVYRIAQQQSLLHSHHPWECMDGLPQRYITVAEGGLELDPSFVRPVSIFFENLTNFIQGKPDDDGNFSEIVKHCMISSSNVGSYLRKGLEAYLARTKDQLGLEWKPLVEALFTTQENTHRNYNAVDDLRDLDFNAEREYKLFPGEEITVAGGYSSIIESLASALPEGIIQLGRKVDRIEWQLLQNDDQSGPVMLHFSDGTSLRADHVIVTVSLGVLKRDPCVFNPPLPSSKAEAISRLGFGLMNKVFLQLPDDFEFPAMQMVFYGADSGLRRPRIPNWIRKSSWLYPIYSNSRVVVSWFAGQEARQLESLSEDEIIDGVSETASDLLTSKLKFGKVLRTQWGSDPLFLGSYSFIAVGSSGDDMDKLSEPLPETGAPQLQIMFAGEATDRVHYGTTHAAYISGLREANRLLKHYNCAAV